MKVLIIGAPSSSGYLAFGIDKKISGGGWVENLIDGLSESKDAQLDLAVCFYAGFTNTVRKQSYLGVCYYALPLKDKAFNIFNDEMLRDLKEAVCDFSPDVVHIIGTEREYNLRLAEIAGFDKTVCSITGLTSICAGHYFGGIDRKYFKRLSIGDLYRRGGPIKEQKRFEKWGRSERELISKAKYVMGRTTWDYACVKQINPDIDYTYCGEILNPIYNEHKWDISKIKRHRIFVSQATYPLKGFHKLLEAFSIILKFYPDSEIVIAGTDILNNSGLMTRIKRTTYAEYLIRLIKKLNIPREKIKFTGLLSAEQMLEQYLAANVFVLPSAIENSPNSLGEAMLLGMPCVASCVGGVQDMLKDKMDGFIYPFDEPYMLAHYICEIFGNDNLAAKLGKSAADSAKERFDPAQVVAITVETYRRIVSAAETKPKSK